MRSFDNLFIGREFYDLPSVSSTNEYAFNLLSKSKPSEGTVISTPRQYAGRGQIGSKWESEAHKNISLSIILYPEFLQIRQQFLLNQAISLAVFDLVEKYFPGKTKIKWPNDIYLEDKKVAGILIQNTVFNARLRSTVVGIGVNINQEVFTSDASNPISFKIEAGTDFEIEQIISQLCRFVENRYLKLKSGNLVPLKENYICHLYRYQSLHYFQRNSGEIFQGRITGLTDIGQLKILSEEKEEHFNLKEIKFL